MKVNWHGSSHDYLTEKGEFLMPFHGRNNTLLQYCIVSSSAFELKGLEKCIPSPTITGHETYVGVVRDMLENRLYLTDTVSNLSRCKKATEELIESVRDLIIM